MQYQFKKFEGRNQRLEDRITLTQSNSIGFPQKFYRDNKINNYKYVLLFWDEHNKAIGINFTNDEKEKNKFTIVHSKKGYGGSVSMRSFFKGCGIDLKVYHGRYVWEKYNLENVGEIYAIKLKEKVEKS